MRTSSSSLAYLAFSGTLAFSAASAQVHLATKDIQSGNAKHFGTSVARLGDIDGDGVIDFAISAPGGAGLASPAPGAVYLFSGASGALLRTLNGTSPGDAFGLSVSSTGDVDGDGKPEVLVGAFSWMARVREPETHTNGSARIYSSASGALIRELAVPTGAREFGWQVACVGDVNSDGVADQAVCAPNTGGGITHGIVAVYSGASGSALYVLTNTTQSEGGFGYSVLSPGDLTGDGRPDIVVGDFSTRSGCVRVYSGADGVLVRTIDAAPGHRLFGAALAGGPDVDQDGTPDFAVGVGSTEGGGGAVRVFSGKDGRELGAVLGSNSFHIGTSIDLVADIDGDLHPDLIVGASVEAAVSVFSLRDTPWTSNTIGAPNANATRFGTSVCSLGAAELGGASRIVVGADWAKNAAGEGVGLAWIVDATTGQVLHSLAP